MEMDEEMEKVAENGKCINVGKCVGKRKRVS